MERNIHDQLFRENNSKRIAAQFEKMNPEDIVASPSELVVPIMEQLSYTKDENLSEILIQLLAASASKTQANLAHPAMLTVAKNLSPDEALIIKEFDRISDIKQQLAALKIIHRETRPERELEYVIKSPCETLIDEQIEGLQYPENIELYIGNMISLGLFEIITGFLGTTSKTAPVEKHPNYEIIRNRAIEKFPFDSEHMKHDNKDLILKSTMKGQMFIRILNNIE